MRNLLFRLAREEEGPTAVEYAVMLALIVVVCLGSVALLSSELGASFDNSSNELNSVLSS
jgi:pilus assembly protein Flp/PilA